MTDRTNFAPPSVGADLEIQIEGKWYEIPGTASFSASGGEAPETEQRNFKGVTKTAGFAGVPTISVTVEPYVPTMFVWQHLRADEGGRYPYRLRTKKSQVAGPADFTSGAQIVIAAAAANFVEGAFSKATLTAAGNFSFEDGRIFLGQLMKVGSKFYRIEEIVDGMNVAVSEGGNAKPAQAGVAALTEIFDPGLELTFTGVISSGSGFELPSGGALTRPLTITPTGALDGWKEITS